ncbi:MAG: oligosaccharide 4-alpha-D-glucosyltransferase [Paraglaciecola sp.]|jgi:oligosaccharide 4-alpha-D-glucosyltransferase
MTNTHFRTFRLLGRYLLVLSLLTLSGTSYAARYLDHELQGQSLVIHSDEGQLRVTAYNSHAFEVFYQPNQTKQLPSFAIGGGPLVTKVTLKDQAQSLSFQVKGLRAVIEKSPLRISYYQGNKLLLAEEVGLFKQDTLRGFRFSLQTGEKLLGGGERILGMDRRGQRFPLYNKAHYGYGNESKQMYFGLPAVMSSNKYALIFDNSASGFMDLGATEADIMQFEAVGGRTSYIVIAGQTYPELIEHYVQVTGTQPLPPRWALGNFASRFGYRTEQETRDTVQRFIDQDFPLDAIVLDLYWFGADIKGHMGNLQWDKNAFPTPVKMIADLKAKGVKTVLITEPFILSSSAKYSSAVKHQALAKNLGGKPRLFDFYFGNTALVDVFDDNASAWFNKVYSKLYKQGVAGWWGDLGEPEVHPGDTIHQLDGVSVTGDEIHNVYGHKWAQRVYENQRAIAPQQRPFIMMRSGFVGSQRYGMIPWTGDVSRSWDGLKPQVELSLQMGLLGMGYTHSDLGGFAGGEVFDRQLYIRWLQYGVFQPVFRPHAQDNIAPEPVFHDKKTRDILRPYVKLRYAMLPYNYTLAYQNSLTGMPLMRPMFFEDESNSALMDIKDQYFWGDAFLIKPITEPGIESISMDLPAGQWFEYWTDKVYGGAQRIKLAVSLKSLPVMVRAGSFVPMVTPVQSTDNYDTDQLELHYYAHKAVSSAQGVMYDDDGANPDALKNGQFETLNFEAQQDDGDLQIDLSRSGEYQGMPLTRELTVVIHNWLQASDKLLVAGNPLPLYTAEAELVQRSSGAWWDEARHILKVKFPWQQNTSLSISTK